MLHVRRRKDEMGGRRHQLHITIQDSRYDHKYNTVWGRLKRAAKALFGKPVYFSDVHLEGEERYKKLVANMTDLLNSNLDEE